MADNTTNSNRKASISKAGKRSGSPVWPAAITPERQAAKELGEQQFIANKQLTTEREKTIIVFEPKLGQFVYRIKKITVSAEYIYDPTRGRVVYIPSFKEKTIKGS